MTFVFGKQSITIGSGPGSDIRVGGPGVHALHARIERSGLFSCDMEAWRLHYALTLDHWHQRFSRARQEIAAHMGERFCRMWEYYLVCCAVAFRCGDLGGVIDALARAEVLSRLAAKDALGAVSVLTRADWYFKRLSADAEKSITKELTKRLLAVSPTAIGGDPGAAAVVIVVGQVRRLGEAGLDQVPVQPSSRIIADDRRRQVRGKAQLTL